MHINGQRMYHRFLSAVQAGLSCQAASLKEYPLPYGCHITYNMPNNKDPKYRK
jgi:hypothetical protein